MKSQHSKIYNDNINTDSYEYQQSMQEKCAYGYSPVYRENLSGCKRLSNERTLDVFELEELRLQSEMESDFGNDYFKFVEFDENDFVVDEDEE